MVSSPTAYAYTEKENIYPILAQALGIKFYDSSWNELYVKSAFNPDDNGVYWVENGYVEGISSILVEFPQYMFNVPYNPDAYDYYFLAIMAGYAGNYETFMKSTFEPRKVRLESRKDNYDKSYNNLNGTVSNFNSAGYVGFSYYGKIEYDDLGGSSFNTIVFHDDAQGVGAKIADQRLQMAVMAVPKGDEAFALEAIYSQLVKMESSTIAAIAGAADQITGAVSDGASDIVDSVNQGTNNIIDSIVSQYDIAPNEDLGIGGLVDDVNSKLGVLSFGSEVMVGMLDLFDPANASSTMLTFPAFSIEVADEEYSIWGDLSYDLSELESQFGSFLTVVRAVLVTMVWLAVLNYVVKSANEFLSK